MKHTQMIRDMLAGYETDAKELSKLTGIPHSTLCTYINDTAKPRPKNRKLIEAAFDAFVEDRMGKRQAELFRSDPPQEADEALEPVTTAKVPTVPLPIFHRKKHRGGSTYALDLVGCGAYTHEDIARVTGEPPQRIEKWAQTKGNSGWRPTSTQRDAIKRLGLRLQDTGRAAPWYSPEMKPLRRVGVRAALLLTLVASIATAAIL